MTQSKTPESVCSVCFATHKLTKKLQPKRHGFSIVTSGYGSGHWGAWHTGPCAGGGFPHFGKSTAGTEWALRACTEQLNAAQDRLAQLEGRPVLEWTPNGYESKVGCGTVSVLDSCPETETGIRYYSRNVEHDSYDALHAAEVRNVDHAIKSLGEQIARYEKAISEWKAFEPKLSLPRSAQRVTHERMSVTRKVRRPGAESTTHTFDNPVCAGRKQVFGANFADSAADVTCSRCLARVETRRKEADKNRAKVDRALSQCKGAGRELLALAGRPGNATGFTLNGDNAEYRAARKLLDVGLLTRSDNYKYHVITDAGRAILKGAA